MKHPYADILIAIANGEQIQFKDPRTLTEVWVDQDTDTAIKDIATRNWLPTRYRVKPKTIMINGVECPEPCDDSLFNICVSGVRDQVLMSFSSEADATTVFNALVKPFKENI